ncbi:MAG: DUF58 domain-containing protein [Candidatus Sumerlaeaceae bacterium]|nr:DUF58 domain-containing protein [Candidatus Sumerlaeaceae bacterium]
MQPIQAHTAPPPPPGGSPAFRRRALPRPKYLITVEGICFLILMQLVGFAAWHSGTNLLYLIFAMLIAFFLAHGLFVWLNLQGLSAKRQFPRDIHALKPFVLHVEVSNRKRWLNSYGLAVADMLPDGSAYAAGLLPSVSRNASAVVECRAFFPRRGRYQLQHLRIITRYPFGLVERSRLVRTPDEVVVLPPVADVSEVLKSLTSDIGEFESPYRGAGTDFSGLREYQPGEHARRIHWRSTARAQRIMVMEFQREEHRTVCLWLDNYCPIEEQNDPIVAGLFERAVILTASLALSLLQSEYEVSLRTVSGSVPSASGVHQAHRILGALALLEMCPKPGAVPSAADKEDPVVELRFRGLAASRRHSLAVDAREWSLQNGVFSRVATS